VTAPFWQGFTDPPAARGSWTESFPATMPDGRGLDLPLRDLGETAVAGLILNQASFAVLDQLAAWVAEAARRYRPEVVVGLPTLGHTLGAALARALGHSNWVAPSTTRKRWYDDALSAPLASITGPATGANAARRMWLDPRLLPRLEGRRVLLVDDVISTGSSAQAGLALLRAAGIVPVAMAVAMIQGELWRAAWPAEIPVCAAFPSPRFRRGPGGWVPIDPDGGGEG
jgi:adenine/guanine phosphoribosyltransferase-like PRPP-binding protein